MTQHLSSPALLELLGSNDDELVDQAINEIVRRTSAAYQSQSVAYRALRHEEPIAFDRPFFDALELEAVKRWPARNWSVLDIGAGYGRDARYLAERLGAEVFALEICDAFIDALTELQHANVLGENHVIKADMRNLGQVASGSINCVRNHASLHHLPLVGTGKGMDQAIAESRRVLSDDGLLYVTTKRGAGRELLDTDEGLGARFFQYLDESQLEELLMRNGMRPILLEVHREERPASTVEWLFTLAEVARR